MSCTLVLVCISALAFLATAAANCEADLHGHRTDIVKRFSDVHVDSGRRKYHIPALCDADGYLQDGILATMCTGDDTTPTVYQDSSNNVYVNSLNGGTLQVIMYCKIYDR